MADLQKSSSVFMEEKTLEKLRKGINPFPKRLIKNCTELYGRPNGYCYKDPINNEIYKYFPCKN